jgi:uncharacterized membrane protein
VGGWGWHAVGCLRHQAPGMPRGFCVVCGGGWLGPWPCLVPVCGGWGGVGLLFEIWIVDASIFVVIVLLVCETSYEGRMVDALASRADEGRWSLR